MDWTLQKLMVLMAINTTAVSINHVHRTHNLGIGARLVLFLHHLVIMIIIIGAFLTTDRFIRYHLLLATGVFVMWFCIDGCFLTFAEKELVDYSPSDTAALHGTYENGATHQLLITLPLILYDFYKLLV